MERPQTQGNLGGPKISASLNKISTNLKRQNTRFQSIHNKFMSQTREGNEQFWAQSVDESGRVTPELGNS